MAKAPAPEGAATTYSRARSPALPPARPHVRSGRRRREWARGFLVLGIVETFAVLIARAGAQRPREIVARGRTDVIRSRPSAPSPSRLQSNPRGGLN